MTVSSYIPLRELFSTWDHSLLTAHDGDSIMDKLGIADFKIAEKDNTTTIHMTIAFDEELGFAIPGLDGMAIHIAPTKTLTVEATVKPAFAVRLPSLAATLRFPATLLKPVTREGDQWVARLGPDGKPAPYEITLSNLAVDIDGDGNITFPNGPPALGLAPAMIGDSGIVIESEAIALYLSASEQLPPNAPQGFKGLAIKTARVYLPTGLADVIPNQLTFTDCFIGTGGFTGEINTAWKPALTGNLFGMDLQLHSIAVGFKQNALVKSGIAGGIVLPFFDTPVDIDIAIATNGNWSVGLTGGQNGLLTLTKPDILDIAVDSLAFKQADGLFAVVISGQITPTFGELPWPTVDLKELTIDSQGHVHIDGGWLDLPNQVSFDLHGFQMELTRLGFGKEKDGSKWVGFSGGVQLAGGLAAAKVDGLKISWQAGGPPAISLSGIAVAFEVPETIRVTGAIAYTEVGGPRFAGEVKVDLMAIGLVIDAQLVVGTDETKTPTYTYFGIALNVDLPAGIPLWATGLGLYGLSGLFALNYVPEKQPEQEWYEGWYKQNPEAVTDITSPQWGPEDGSVALGGGITIGTIADNGFIFSGRVLLLIVVPGPIIMLEGRANFLSSRSSLNDDAIFRALAVLDGRAGTLEIGLAADWKIDDKGMLLDIGGDVDTYFDFTDASKFHLYLGQKDPMEKRMHARIFSMLETQSYLMIDATRIATGVWTGIDEHWDFGPVSAYLEAWIEGNAELSWKPVHFHGDAWLHGAVGLHIFGFGFDLAADARLDIDAPTPFHIMALLHLLLKLPWPLPDVDVTATLEWGPENPPPPTPMVLQEVAIEHLKSSDSWLLPRPSHLPPGATQPLLLPEYSDGKGYLDIAHASATVSATADKKARLASPAVPLDARPHLTFARSVHDAATVGVNPQPPSPPVELVAGLSFQYTLNAVVLQKWQASQWVTAAAAPANGAKALYGSWAPVPAIPDPGGKTAQTKLWLWSLNPYDFAGLSGRAWEDWFGDAHPDYPCVPAVDPEEHCYDLEKQVAGSLLSHPFPHPENHGVVFDWTVGQPHQVVANPPYAVLGRTHALYFASLRNGLTVSLRQPAQQVIVLVATAKTAKGANPAQAVAHTVGGAMVGPVAAAGQAGITLVAPPGDTIDKITVAGQQVWFMGICATTLDQAQADLNAGMEKHMLTELDRWSDDGAVLEPDTYYRLEVRTEVKRSDMVAPQPFKEYAYFRTEGPPGLATYTKPLQLPAQEPFTTPLTDLHLYLKQTLPANGTKPVYRAYDVGVAFNETYVELMYRLAGRDLGIYLYDSNSRPLRDAAGRLLVVDNAWGKGERTLTATEERWVLKVNGCPCAVLDPKSFAKPDTMVQGAPNRVLHPDLVHTARLIPLLLHADFHDGTTDGWTVIDEPGAAPASAWTVDSEQDAYGTKSYYVLQTANTYGGTVAGKDPVKPGTLLVRGDQTWTDYRLTVTMRSADNDALGVSFRRKDGSNYYRFAMDRERRYRRLVKCVNGVTTVLAEDAIPYQPDRDYTITVEAVGSDLAVYVDGVRFCSVKDGSLPAGGIGLYCWASVGARFANVRVDDFRKDAVAVHAFKFTTSQFANLHHQMHSYDDETWKLGVSDPTALASATTYEAAVTAIFGSPTRPLPERVTVSRIDNRAWLIESPEPIDWARTDLSVSRAGRTMASGEVPAVFKLTGSAFGPTAQPNDETVSLVLRDHLDPMSYAVEANLLPGPIAVPDQASLLAERFADTKGGLLYAEAFGPAALDLYKIIDEGKLQGPSHWQVQNGYISQLSNVYGPERRGSLHRPGTLALTGDVTWTGVRLTVTMEPHDNDAIGVAFRCTDAANYYLFEMDREQKVRRLVRRVAGKVSVLWQDQIRYEVGQPYTLVVEAYGDVLVGYLNDALLFAVTDGSLKAGGIALYCAAHQDARFTQIRVDALSAPTVLWHPTPGSLPPGSIYTAAGPWADYQVALKLRSSSDGTLGAILRWQDRLNYYRLTLERTTKRRRFTRVANGVATVLWQSSGQGYDKNKVLDLTLRARGAELSAYLNGQALFHVTDGSIRTGHVGTYASRGNRMTVLDLLVSDQTRRIGAWRVVDDGDQGGPSAWLLDGEALVQASNIHGGAPGAPNATGTYVVGGDPTWTDCRVQARLRSDNDGMIGLLLRYQDKQHYYRLTVDADQSKRRLTRHTGGVITTLWEDGGKYIPGKPFTWTVDLVGDRLTGYMDGKQAFDLHDGQFSAGQIGLFAGGNDGARFEWVSVARPPLDSYALFKDAFSEGDTSAWTILDDPAASGGPSDWTVDATGGGAFRQLSDIGGKVFTKPLIKPGTRALGGNAAWGDYSLSLRCVSTTDGAMGAFFRYKDGQNFYRFAVTPTRRWLYCCVGGVYQLLWHDFNGYAPGTEVALTVVCDGSELRAYVAGIPVFVISDSTHGHGRIGLYASHNQGVAFANVRVWPLDRSFDGYLLDEHFAGDTRIATADVPHAIGTATLFTVIDEQSEQPTWAVAPGELTLSPAVGALIGPGLPVGTYALADGNPGSDYRVSIRCQTSLGGTVGLLVRYADADNHYRLVLDGHSHVRHLWHVLNGQASLVWFDNNHVLLPGEHMLTMDCQGDALAGYLDGVELFRLGNAASHAGSIGLWCTHHPVVFREVRLASADWNFYYRFGPGEQPLPAGTRIAIHGGHAAALTAPAPGVAHRHACGDGETDGRRLDQASARSGVRLRVKAPDGAGEHDRVCLPDDDFAPFLVAKLLRKQDGTGLIVTGTGGMLPIGVYRLGFTYRRDNTVADPQSTVLSQAGDTTDEQATLDLPWQTR